MNKSDIMTLFEYSYWANRRILNAASRVTQEQFTTRTTFPRGNLRATLLHIMDAEYAWRILLQESREVDDLAEPDFPTIDAVASRWREEETAMRAYLATLTDENMQGKIHYTNYRGIKRERVLWQCLFQVLNHGTQHRSEAAAMLTDFGQSPGDVDFSIFVAESLQPVA